MKKNEIKLVTPEEYVKGLNTGDLLNHSPEIFADAYLEIMDIHKKRLAVLKIIENLIDPKDRLRDDES